MEAARSETVAGLAVKAMFPFGCKGFVDLHACLQALSDAGHSVPRLAEELGTTVCLVSRALAELGVRLQPQPARLAQQRQRAAEERVAEGVAELGFADLASSLRVRRVGPAQGRSRLRHRGLPREDRTGLSQRQLNDNPPLLPVVAGAHPGKRAAEQRVSGGLQHAGKVAGTPAKRPVQAAEDGLQRLVRRAGRRRLNQDDPGVGVVQRDGRWLQRQADSCRPQGRHRSGELLEGLPVVELAIGPGG
ncbi:MAG TPA: hypothetical protein VFA46_08890 [Actinomycetes bacterium]|nr:hypothetical protein [Actinomycetes bacterium]